MKSCYTLFLLLITSCGTNENSNSINMNRENAMIAANDGEVPFDEQYGLSISLPMPERKFLNILENKHLRYRISGDISQGLAIPKPRLSNSVKEENISRMYQIYGGIENNNRFGRVYRAFVNKSGEVIYIENAFEYPGM